MISCDQEAETCRKRREHEAVGNVFDLVLDPEIFPLLKVRMNQPDKSDRTGVWVKKRSAGRVAQFKRTSLLIYLTETMHINYNSENMLARRINIM